MLWTHTFPTTAAGTMSLLGSRLALCLVMAVCFGSGLFGNAVLGRELTGAFINSETLWVKPLIFTDALLMVTVHVQLNHQTTTNKPKFLFMALVLIWLWCVCIQIYIYKNIFSLVFASGWQLSVSKKVVHGWSAQYMWLNEWCCSGFLNNVKRLKIDMVSTRVTHAAQKRAMHREFLGDSKHAFAQFERISAHFTHVVISINDLLLWNIPIKFRVGVINPTK